MYTDNSVFCKQFWFFCNSNMSCRTRIYRHEPCQMPENGCLASSINQFLCLFLVYLKGVNLYCCPFFFWPLLETGLEERSEFKLKFSTLAYPSDQILWYLERTISFEWLEIKINWGIKWQASCHNSFLLFLSFYTEILSGMVEKLQGQIFVICSYWMRLQNLNFTPCFQTLMVIVETHSLGSFIPGKA